MSRPAPVARAILAVTALELRLALRRGENLLVTAVVPAAVLVFFATQVPLAVSGPAVDFLLPGALTLGVIATSMVSLGISTAYERHYGVLKRLAAAPLPGWGILAAKAAVVVVVETVQVVLLLAIAVVLLDWRPPAGASALLALGSLVLGTLAFAGLGLSMAGRLRAETTLAVANGLFLAFLLVGGVVVPVDHLPGPLAAVARLLPAAALSDVLRSALDAAPLPRLALPTLTGWAVAMPALAARVFRWD